MSGEDFLIGFILGFAAALVLDVLYQVLRAIRDDRRKGR
jgi:hypothetical protein